MKRMRADMDHCSSMLAHPLHQLPGREGLGHVGVGAERETLRHLGVPALRGEHQDPDVGQRGIGLDLLTDFEAALLRHHHVEQHQIRAVAADALDRLLAVVGDQHLEAFALHQELERNDDVRLVVGNQYFLDHASPPEGVILSH